MLNAFDGYCHGQNYIWLRNHILSKPYLKTREWEEFKTTSNVSLSNYLGGFANNDIISYNSKIKVPQFCIFNSFKSDT